MAERRYLDILWSDEDLDTSLESGTQCLALIWVYLDSSGGENGSALVLIVLAGRKGKGGNAGCGAPQ